MLLRIFLVLNQSDTPFPPLEDDLVLIAKTDEAGKVENGISGLTGAGVDRLIGDVLGVLDRRTQRAGTAMRARHRFALDAAVAGIAEAKSAIDAGGSEDIVAEELRAAISAVDMIVGRVDVEDLLGEIFSSFCIGK